MQGQHAPEEIIVEISILGAGAMGCLFGARLLEAGHRVELVEVDRARVAAIAAAGLTVEDDRGTRTVAISIRPPGGARPAELVLLFTKAFQGAAALEASRALLGPETWVLTLQNGLGNVEAIAAHVARSRVVVGATTVPADRVGPARVRSHGVGLTAVMTAAGGEGPRLQAVAAALEGAGFPCAITPDVWARIWEKVAFNAALNALTAVTGLTVGELGAAPEGRRVADSVADEVVGVAHALGIAADRAAVARSMAMAFRDHPGHRPSMLQDLDAGRATEIGQINGAVVAEAARLGCAVPFTALLHDLVRALERSPRRGASPR
jgi:2-dehydropantoate 2-reductase